MTTQEWIETLRRYSRCSIVDMTPKQCGELANLMDALFHGAIDLSEVPTEIIEVPANAVTDAYEVEGW